MARRRKEPDQPAGCPAWLATYGDMITLVLTFFVLLYSMSTIDANKWKALVMNLNGTNSIFEVVENTSNDGDLGLDKPPEVSDEEYTQASDKDEWGEIVESVLEAAEGINNELGGGQVIVTVEYNDAQIIIRVNNDILFATARADLLPESLPIIHDVMSKIVVPHLMGKDEISELSIQGHADVRRLGSGSKYEDNWELSTARAVATLRYILDNYDIPDDMIGAVGYGSSRPVNGDFGTNEAVWKNNRRVEFVMIRNFLIDKATGQGYESK